MDKNQKSSNKLIYQDNKIIKFLIESPKYGNFDCIIDTEVWDKVKQFRWYIHYNIKTKKVDSVNARINGKVTPIHKFLTGFKMTDHKNLNIFDNRKENLRKCNKSQNAMNMRIKSNNKTGYKGVYYSKRIKKYGAMISKNNNKIQLGYYNDPIHAAIAYDVASKLIFGEFARLNLTEHKKDDISVY